MPISFEAEPKEFPETESYPHTDCIIYGCDRDRLTGFVACIIHEKWHFAGIHDCRCKDCERSRTVKLTCPDCGIDPCSAHVLMIKPEPKGVKLGSYDV